MKIEVNPMEQTELAKMMLQEAIKEGWPYSQEDVDFFYHCPGNHFFSLKVEGNLAGCFLRHESSTIFQGKKVWFLGFLLVLKSYRGLHLWQLTDFVNQDKDKIISFNSVPKAASLYEKIGFIKLPFMTLHHTLLASSFKNCENLESLFKNGTLKVLHKDTLSLIDTYLDSTFPQKENIGLKDFMKHWTHRSDATIVGYFEKGQMQGLGITTLCKNENLSFRIAPLYAHSDTIATLLVKGLVFLALRSKGVDLNISAPSTASPRFLSSLQEMGFAQDGKNFIFSNSIGLEVAHFAFSSSVFGVAPLEFTHELIADLF